MRPPVTARAGTTGMARAAAAGVVHAVRLVPGLAAAGCAVAGVYLLAGLGWTLLAAAGLLLALDWRLR